MTIWLVVSIIALILSPLAWLRPSRNESVRMNLRLEGRRMGLAMQMAPQQWPHWLGRHAPDPCPQYHRGRRKGCSDTWSYWQVSPGVWLNQWREPCEDDRVLAQLARLPESVYKVEAGTQMLALYWSERGEKSVLQDIAQVLEALA